MFHNLTADVKANFEISQNKLKIISGSILLCLVFAVVGILLYIIQNVLQGKPTHEEIWTQYIVEYLHNKYDNRDLINNDININTFSYSSVLYPSVLWYGVNSHFQKTCHYTLELIYETIKDPFNAERNQKIWTIVETVINEICKKIRLPIRAHQLPFLTNWYHFSRELTLLIAVAHIVYLSQQPKPNKKPNKIISYWFNNIIPAILQSPRESMGWTRSSSNTVMMAVPWLSEKIFNHKSYANNADFKYVVNYISIKFVTSGEGFYHDGGFIMHTNCRAYGYIYDAALDFQILSKFFKIKRTFEQIKKIKLLLDHPTIKYHNPSLFSRGSSIRMNYILPEGSLGFDVIPSMSILSIKQENSMLQFYGQNANHCFYEADQDNNDLCQYWLMARQYLYSEGDAYLLNDYITRYPGIISINNQKAILPSETSTTQTFLPSPESFSIVCKVGETCVAMYNEYYIDEFYFRVEEIILVYETGYTVNYYIKAEDDMSQHDNIMVSVNFDRINKNDVNAVDNINSSFVNKVHHFINNSSIIHNVPKFTQLVKTTKIPHPENGENIHSLQIQGSANADGVFCTSFSTYNDNTPPIVNHTNRRRIITSNYKTFFHNDCLYICDINANKVAVGVKSNIPLSNLSHKFADIDTLFGTNTTIDNRGIKDVASSAYIEMTNYMRNYSTFSNATIPDDATINNLFVDIEW
uniref:ODV-E66 n=1 Tax=Drosophila-associated filamentous virus TaxID=2743186 RepID=A0A6M9U108_9VIRU|nr:putative protein 65 [Drosophila-associated filamentous virus]